MSHEKLEASIFRPKRSIYFAIPSPITGLFSTGCVCGQCQDMDPELKGSWLRDIQQVPQNPAGESLLIKPIPVCNASSNCRSCARLVTAMTRSVTAMTTKPLFDSVLESTSAGQLPQVRKVEIIFKVKMHNTYFPPDYLLL